MLAVKVKEAMEAYRRRHGVRLTYRVLAERTGLSQATVEAIASRDDYNTTLSAIEKLCVALECDPGELLELIPDEPERAS